MDDKPFISRKPKPVWAAPARVIESDLNYPPNTVNPDNIDVIGETLRLRESRGTPISNEVDNAVQRIRVYRNTRDHKP